MKLSFQHIGFRGRLLAAMLTLALVTSLAIAAAFMISTFAEEKDRARERLDVASDVVREILARRNSLLVNTLSVLVDDFGFKSAIATRELPTMLSVLENHSQRFNADLAILTDRSGAILANLQGLKNDTRLPFTQLLDSARQQGAATGLVTLGDQAYQALLVPVQAPGLRAWLIMGFSLNDRFAHVVSDLTGVEVIFESAGPDQRYFGRSLEAADMADIMSKGDLDLTGNHMTGNLRYFTRTARLTNDEDDPVTALLLLDRQKALANYYRMALDLGLLVIACLAIAGVLALGLARTLGRPVLKLARFADLIGENLDSPPPQLKAHDELRNLEHALTSMVKKIQHREHRIRHDANHDTLTGLPNRPALERHLKQVLARRERGFLASVAITGLKELSETLGYDFGNEVIIATALRIRGMLATDCLLARSGGNELITYVPGDDEEAFHDILTRLRAAAEESMQINGTPVSIELTVAILRLPDHAESLDHVRRRISLTMDLARRSENHTATYVEGGEELHLRELQIIRDLQQAMVNRELTMVYQPKVRFDSVRLIQVEALVRWQHAELGFLNPEEFIALAERSGQIHELTDYILRQVERDSRIWHQAGMSDIGVAINLSALDLTNKSLPNLIATVFVDWPQPLSMLTFEITESAAMTDTQSAVRTLGRLRELGAKLSVDDFGTGYSSLSQMRQLPVQELKIDKSFVLKLDSTPQDQLIVKSTIDMAHGLGLSVVAEGIENEGSWRLLQSWGCELAQGYFLGRPMDATQLVDWFGEFNASSGHLVAGTAEESRHEARSRS